MVRRSYKQERSARKPSARRRCDLMRLDRFLGQRVGLEEPHAVSPQFRDLLQHRLAGLLLKQDAVIDAVGEDETTIPREIDVDDLNVRLAPRQIVLPRKGTAH